MGMFDDVLEKVGEPFTGGKGFAWGTHEVVIMQADAKQKKISSNPKAEVIEVIVADEKDNDRTATATLYFHTEGGAKMSVIKILGILVHNSGEEKKDKVRALGKKLFGSIDDPLKARDVAAKLLSDSMIGKKAFAVAEPRGKYKTTNYVDIWHYAAEPQGEPEDDAQEAAKAVGGSVVDDSEIPEDLDL